MKLAVLIAMIASVTWVAHAQSHYPDSCNIQEVEQLIGGTFIKEIPLSLPSADVMPNPPKAAWEFGLPPYEGIPLVLCVPENPSLKELMSAYGAVRGEVGIFTQYLQALKGSK